MEAINLTFSLPNLLFILLIASFSSLLFFVLKQYIENTHIKGTSLKKKKYYLWLYAFEIIFFIIGLIILMYLSLNNIVFSIVFLIIALAGLSWLLKYYIKDYFSGVLIKLKSGFQEGDRLSINGHTGSISQLGLTQVKIKIQDNGFLLINNTDFLKAEKIILESKHLIKSHQFTLKGKASIEQAIYENSILETLNNLPWIDNNFSPQIAFKKINTNEVEIQVSILAYDSKYYAQIEQQIYSKIELL